MTGDEFVKAKLAEAAWRCRRSGGIMAMMAVAFIIRNRVKTLDESWLEASDVLLDGARSEGLADQSDPEIRDPEFIQILHAVDGIFDDRIPDKLTAGALDCYQQGASVLPTRKERVAVVGQLVLCK